jgi:putative chitinase
MPTDAQWKSFFDYIRTNQFHGSLTQGQVDGMRQVISEGVRQGCTDPRMHACVLAMDYHETQGKMQPVSENLYYTDANRIVKVFGNRNGLTTAKAVSLTKNPKVLANFVYGGEWGRVNLGNTQPNDGWDMRGMGDIQLTGRALRAKFSTYLGIDLLSNPSALLDSSVSKQIMWVGMLKGYFRGRKLSDFITDTKTDFINARAIVNADVAANGKLIASYADRFLVGLNFLGKLDDATVSPMPAEPIEVVPEPSAPTLWERLVAWLSGRPAA